MSIKSSIVVPTINRPASLKKTIESMLDQTILPDEIIIVDQGKNDESHLEAVGCIERYKKDNAHNVPILKYAHDPEISGAAQARNRGIDSATGDVVFFFDDDIILDRDYIKETLNVYESYPEVAGVGGVITNYSFTKRPKVRMFNSMFMWSLFRDERQEIYGKYAEHKRPIVTNKLSGGCSSYRRAILREERFDESFDIMFNRYSFGEDIDLSLRISKRHKLMIAPYSRATHMSDSHARTRKQRNQVVHHESASWTYIFNAHMDKNIMNYFTYYLACIGWYLRAAKGLLRLDYMPARSLAEGIKKGKVFSRLDRGKSND